MDTLRDKHVLEEMWDKGKAPWKVWDRPRPRRPVPRRRPLIRRSRGMRVLLTGADGYIGAIMGPKLHRGRPRRHRPRHRLLPPRLALRRRPRPSQGGLQGPPRASTVDDLDRLRRRGAPLRALERPDRRERPRADHGDQPPGLGRRSPRRPSRPASGASSTPPPARPTAPAATRCAPRRATLAPQTAYAKCKILVEQEVAPMAGRPPSPRSSCATPPPTAPARGSASTSCSTTSAASPTPSARSA